MRIRTIGIVGLVAAFALFAGADSAQAKSGKRHHHGSCGHKVSCCSSEHCCRAKSCNDAGAVLWKKGNCKTELELMKLAGMCTHDICGKGPVTIFCPTDAAYAKLGKARLDDLKSDPKKLKAAMEYHIVKKKVTVADIKAGGWLPTMLDGYSLSTNVKDGKAEVDGCLIVEPDVAASNGVVQILDDVPLPERGK